MSELIKAGFNDVVFDAQSVFRKVLKSMAEPGHVSSIDCDFDDKPEVLNVASYSIALALFDHDTKISLLDSLNDESTKKSLGFHCSSPIEEKLINADFVLCDETEIPVLTDLKLGTEEYPDESCTLIIQVKNILKVGGCHLTGAGIQNQREIDCSALSEPLIQQREKLQKLFPLGVDLIFTTGEEFFCLPRTTKVHMINTKGDT